MCCEVLLRRRGGSRKAPGEGGPSLRQLKGEQHCGRRQREKVNRLAPWEKAEGERASAMHEKAEGSRQKGEGEKAEERRWQLGRVSRPGGESREAVRVIRSGWERR